MLFGMFTCGYEKLGGVLRLGAPVKVANRSAPSSQQTRNNPMLVDLK